MSLGRMLASAALAGLALSGVAEGRVKADSGYSKAQTYNAALRYLRVDLDCEVTERDADAAYLMFRYPVPGRKTLTNGSIEIVETEGAVRVFVQLPKLPEYHEHLLKDGLIKKLGDEYGDPPSKAPPKDEKAPPKKSNGKGSDPAEAREG
jgi:outer membrane murein-binding lipoprotein Lpp